ncbi:MAG: glycosyltransferase family 4 protein [Candidatus Riflebacteria bacterium]|nr:glycosyltransferase family 4 protein [Candidatus Riflebacteria bacterium]
MNILHITNYFPPEVGAGPHLPFEMGEWLVKAGHKVTIVTNFPRYNLPVMPDKYAGRLLFKEEMGGMRVLRVNSPNFYGTRRISRGLVQLLTPPLLGLCALGVSKPDVVVTDTPPLLLGIAARAVALRFGVPYVTCLMDLFPQAIVDVGLLQNPYLISLFEAMERYVYRTSGALVILGENYRDNVVAKGANPDNIFIVPTWADTEMLRPMERMNTFRRENGLGDKFIVLFAGTMGWFQGLDIIIEAARGLVAESDLLFLLVGDGVERAKLEGMSSGLPNVRFLPMQPREVYPQVLAACDIGVVTLHPEVSAPTTPSKIMSIMAAGRTVLASLPEQAGKGARRLLELAECGLILPAGDTRAFISAILQLKRDRPSMRQMEINGRAYAEKHLSRAASIGKFEQVLEKVTRRTSHA